MAFANGKHRTPFRVAEIGDLGDGGLRVKALRPLRVNLSPEGLAASVEAVSAEIGDHRCGSGRLRNAIATCLPIESFPPATISCTCWSGR